MKTIGSWNDLQPFGIIILTGEACGLGFRILFDVTERGRQIVGRCLGVPNIVLAEAWNQGSTEDPHVGSILLTQEMLIPLAVFALLEAGCSEAYLMRRVVVGIEPDDPPGAAETMRKAYGVEYARRFRFGGTAGDRNVHQRSGRVE